MWQPMNCLNIIVANNSISTTTVTATAAAAATTTTTLLHYSNTNIFSNGQISIFCHVLILDWNIQPDPDFCKKIGISRYAQFSIVLTHKMICQKY